MPDRLFGFLFVTVSSRLTGEIGSSSNPISGMTIATLLLTCLIFVAARLDRPRVAVLTALSIAAVVCIASSNGGTTSQDLKTGYLVGATPRTQQFAILVGALDLGRGHRRHAAAAQRRRHALHEQGLARRHVPTCPPTPRGSRSASRTTDDDDSEYRVVHVRKDDDVTRDVKPGRYLVDDDGQARRTASTCRSTSEAKKMDNGADGADGVHGAAAAAVRARSSRASSAASSSGAWSSSAC